MAISKRNFFYLLALNTLLMFAKLFQRVIAEMAGKRLQSIYTRIRNPVRSGSASFGTTHE